jgi:hypothetical protein
MSWRGCGNTKSERASKPGLRLPARVGWWPASRSVNGARPSRLAPGISGKPLLPGVKPDTWPGEALSGSATCCNAFRPRSTTCDGLWPQHGATVNGDAAVCAGKAGAGRGDQRSRCLRYGRAIVSRRGEPFQNPRRAAQAGAIPKAPPAPNLAGISPSGHVRAGYHPHPGVSLETSVVELPVSLGALEVVVLLDQIPRG